MSELLTRLKQMKADKVLMFLLAGILLLVICIPTKKAEQDISSNSSGSSYSGSVGENIGGSLFASGSSTGLVSQDSLETQLEELLHKIDGVGQVKVMITGNSEYNQIEGVVVVAEGAENPKVRQEIIETAQALFPIAAYKVKVCKMAGGQL